MSLSDKEEDHITFTVQTDTSFYEITAPAVPSHYHQYTLVWQKASGTIQIYIDGELVKQQSGRNIRTFSPELKIHTNFLTIGSYYDMTVTDIRYYRLSDLKVWRYPLGVGEVKELMQSKNVCLCAFT